MISINRDTTAMIHIHVCSVGVGPCDDPEDQFVLSIGSKGLLFTGVTSASRSDRRGNLLCESFKL